MSAERRAVAAVAALFFTNGFVLGTWLPRLPELRDTAGLSSAGLGWTLMAAGVVGLGTSAVAGNITDRLGSARTTVVAALGLASVLPLFGWAGGAVLLAGVVGLVALTDTITDVAMNTQAVQAQDRFGGSIINRIHAIFSLGTVAGTAGAAGAAGAGVGPLAHFTAAAVLLVIVVFVARPHLLRDDPATDDDDQPERSARIRPPARLLALLAVLGLVTGLAEIPTGNWASISLADDFGVGESVAAFGFGGVAVGMLVGRFLADGLVDRFGRVRVRRSAAAATLAGLVLVNLAPTAETAIAAYVVSGLGIAALFPLLYLAAGQATGGSGVGLSAMTVGMRTSVLIEGPLIGSLTTVLPTAGALLVVAGASATLLVLAPAPPGAGD